MTNLGVSAKGVPRAAGPRAGGIGQEGLLLGFFQKLQDVGRHFFGELFVGGTGLGLEFGAFGVGQHVDLDAAVTEGLPGLFFKCYDSFDAIKDKLKYLLLTAHSKSKKAHEYSEKLVNGLKILALIRKHPGISTQKLSELTELPLRSVQRYIAALQATGEWIEYDRALRGWKLFHGISILYGDV